LKDVTDEEALSTEGTPQNLAQSWLINDDPYYACPQDPTIVNRFVMAVLYYSLNGDDWAKCSAPTDFADPAAVAEARANCPGTPWFMEESECLWTFLTCNSKNETERIDIGEFETPFTHFAL
jgi:hypothetical protein